MSESSISPSRRNNGTRVASIGASRLPAGNRATHQQVSSAAITRAGYSGSLVVRGAATRTVPARRS